VPIRQRAVDRGRARGFYLVVELCREAEEARLGRNLTYVAIGRALRISGWQAARILRGQSPKVSLVRLAEVLAVVGLDLSARAFPGGVPLRDAAHLALLERLRARPPASVGWRLEVPIVGGAPASDLGLAIETRAWDALISGPNWAVAVEAETRVRDVQALERRIALKSRDGRVSTVLLLMSDTRHHRRILDEPNPSLRLAFPGTARSALRALAVGQPIAANSIVLL
jgi:hypothetical protein